MFKKEFLKPFFNRILLLLLLAIATVFFIVLDVETWLLVNTATTKIPVFGFHNIIEINPEAENTKPPYGLDYSMHNFENFLEYLIRENYWFLSSNELYSYFLQPSQPIPTEHVGQQAIMLTFDDGYKSVYTKILPLLEKLQTQYNENIKIVLFINPKVMNDPKKHNKYVTCEELKEGVKKNFFDVQSHGFSHKRLTEISRSELIEELAEGQKYLQICTKDIDKNKTVALHIAYAYNDSNQKVESYASNYYFSGFLYNHKILKLGWFKNIYQIPRLKVTVTDPPEKLIKMAEISSELKADKPKVYSGRRDFNLFIDYL